MMRKSRPSVPRQRTLAWDAPVLVSLTVEERARAVSLLAQLLLEASCAVEQESGDEEP